MHMYIYFSYTYICIIFFQTLFPCRLLQNIDYTSLFYTVGPYWLSILYVVEKFTLIEEFLFDSTTGTVVLTGTVL